MNPPENLKYLVSHEWHRAEGDTVTIGITQVAADELTDITFVQLPKVGDKLTANKPFGEVESVKATSDLYTGVSGAVTAINTELAANPGLVNKDPYGAGWMVKVKASNLAELSKLLSPADYLKQSGH